jgi:hypothetical protein
MHPAGRFGLSVPLRWRPAHGCGRSKTLNVVACRVQVHVRFEQVQSGARRCKQEIKSGTPGRAGGLFQLAPQRGKKLESPEGDITCPA